MLFTALQNAVAACSLVKTLGAQYWSLHLVSVRLFYLVCASVLASYPVVEKGERAWYPLLVHVCKCSHPCMHLTYGTERPSNLHRLVPSSLQQVISSRGQPYVRWTADLCMAAFLHDTHPLFTSNKCGSTQKYGNTNIVQTEYHRSLVHVHNYSGYQSLSLPPLRKRMWVQGSVCL